MGKDFKLQETARERIEDFVSGELRLSLNDWHRQIIEAQHEIIAAANGGDGIGFMKTDRLLCYVRDLLDCVYDGNENWEGIS